MIFRFFRFLEQVITSSTFVVLIILIGMIIPGVYLFVLKINGQLSFGAEPDHDILASFGTFVAGTTGTLWGFAGLIFIYKTFRQSSIQQFESTYLGMLNILNDIVSNASGQHKTNRRWPAKIRKASQNDKQLSGIKYFSMILSELKQSVGEKVHMEEFQREYPEENCFSIKYKDIEVDTGITDPFVLPNQPVLVYTEKYIEYEFLKVHENYQSDLGHFFRYVHNLIKLVESNQLLNEKEKSRYVGYIQAMLSNDLLGLLFYNGITTMAKNKKGEPEFRKNLDKYHFFQNIDYDCLIQIEDLKFYPLTFGKANVSL